MFSILIPTWNNLAYLKVCIESIQKNSEFTHQIIVHINEGTDGTLEWIKEQKNIVYSHSTENIGICKALNCASKLATTNFICYFNDDMYALPNWDSPIAIKIKEYNHELYFISATMIEPKPGKDLNIIQGKDFGELLNFNEDSLLAQDKSLTMHDWNGASWPPNVVPKTLWDIVGGYSEEFSPGMYSDPDFSMKLWQCGVREFVGLGNSKVYHFMSKSTGKVVKNNGRKQFMQKWGITPGYLYRNLLKMGTAYNGALKTPRKGLAYWLSVCKARLN